MKLMSPYNPNAISDDPLLDAVFGGALPLIRGPVQLVMMGDGNHYIMMDDGDHLISEIESWIDDPKVLELIATLLNQAYRDWEIFCDIKEHK